MTADQKKALERSDELYELYAKPLEATHWGQYIAIQQDGRFVVGKDMMTVIREAREKLGTGVSLLKIGPRAVGKWR